MYVCMCLLQTALPYMAVHSAIEALLLLIPKVMGHHPAGAVS